MNISRRRIWIVLLAFGLLVGACGGGDDDTAAEQSPSPTQPPATEAPNQPATAAPSDEPADQPTAAPSDEPADEPMDEPSSSGDENRAVVTVGDKTYEFNADVPLVGRCDPDFFGGFWVSATGVDDPSNGLNILIVPEEVASNFNETSTITVNLKDSEGLNWRADEDGGEGADPGTSQVTSFNIDGNTVTGTASFIDTYNLGGETAEGTFTATCPAG